MQFKLILTTILIITGISNMAYGQITPVYNSTTNYCCLEPSNQTDPLQNVTSPAYFKCIDSMEQNMKTKYASFDEERAKTMAINYSKFQSEVKNDKYTFVAISGEWKNDQVNCDATFQSALVLFNVFDASGKQREVTVFVDPMSYQPKGIDVEHDLPTHGGVVTTLVPLKQLKSGTNAKDVKCKQDLQLIFKAEDSSPVCVTSNTAQKLIYRGWAIAGFTYGGGPVKTSTIKVTHADMTVVEDAGTTVIGNQTYYFTTLNDTLTIYHGIAAIPFTFHNVDFTLFPNVFSAGPAGSCGDTNFGAAVKFADMTYERLDVHIPGSPCIENYTETAFTNHENSQVGLEDYYGKIRLLVSDNSQPSSALQLSLLVDGQYQNPAEPVGIDVYLNNTTSKPLTLTDSSNWPRNDLTSGMCSNLPFGMSILSGYYDEQNMTGVKSLLLYGPVPCPFMPQIKSYAFEPFSTRATQECDTLFSCTGLVDMKKHFDIGDYIDNNNPHQPFKTGTYTIVAGDKWGNVAIQHFTEANTIAYDNSSISKGN